MKSKKRIFLWILTLLSLVLTVIGTGILIMTKKVNITSFFAKQYEMQGIDVSHYQGVIDWEKIEEQGIDFAYIKATEGSGHVDECFYENWQAAGQTDLLIGAYHFFSFDSGGDTQAEIYRNTVGDLSGRLVPVIDVEYYGDKEKNPKDKEAVIRELRQMLTILEDSYGKNL